MSGLAVAIGPVVGGYLVEHVSWQSIFFVNVPVGLIGLALTTLVVRESKDPSKSRRIDPPGLVTGTAGLFFLVYALIEGNARGWSDGLILGAFALAAALLALFFRIESRRESPMLPLSFFRIPTFAAANVVAAAVFFSMFGTVFFLTLYLQNIRAYSPVSAGLRLFAFSVVILFVAPMAGRLSDRYGSRWFMTFGPLTAAGGMALMLRTQVDSSYLTVILPSFIVLAAGLASTMTPMTAAVMGSVDVRHAGVASAATNTSRELGGVFGIALLGACVTAAFNRGFLARLIDAGIPSSRAQSIVASAGARAAAGNTGRVAANSVVGQAVQQSFVHAIHVGMLIAVGFMVLASVVSFLFVRSHVGLHESGGPGGDGRVAGEPSPREVGVVGD
jgi:EmrB/QacA subfamily drug resistance transporter